MGTQRCKGSAITASRTARLRWVRQRRYLKQDNLGHPILVLHIPTYRSDKLSAAVQK